MFLYICSIFREMLGWFYVFKGLLGTCLLARSIMLEVWRDVVAAMTRVNNVNRAFEMDRDELV